MINYSHQKQPAFFRIMSPELFFEAEAMDTEKVLETLNNSIELDTELEALLNKEAFLNKSAEGQAAEQTE